MRPTFPPLESIVDRFAAALKSGVVTNGGPYVEQFEAELTEYLGVETICFSSGMAALVAMLMVEGVNKWEIIVPSFTFCATPHAVLMAGGKVVFADIDPLTLTLDPKDVERKITVHTKAILGVDVYGLVCGPELAHVADRNHVDLLLDSAPSFGSIPIRPDRTKIYSFHGTKPFAIGEGGALSSNEKSFISEAKKIRNFGQPDTIGLNGKLQEINALIGLEQLKSFPTHLLTRTLAAGWMSELLAGIPGLRWIKPSANQAPSWTYFPILVEPDFGISRDTLIDDLSMRGIRVRKYYEACHLMGVYRKEKTHLPVTERIASQVVSLPIYNSMTAAECERIAGAIREIQEEGR